MLTFFKIIQANDRDGFTLFAKVCARVGLGSRLVRPPVVLSVFGRNSSPGNFVSSFARLSHQHNRHQLSIFLFNQSRLDYFNLNVHNLFTVHCSPPVRTVRARLPRPLCCFIFSNCVYIHSSIASLVSFQLITTTMSPAKRKFQQQTRKLSVVQVRPDENGHDRHDKVCMLRTFSEFVLIFFCLANMFAQKISALKIESFTLDIFHEDIVGTGSGRNSDESERTYQLSPRVNWSGFIQIFWIHQSLV